MAHMVEGRNHFYFPSSISGPLTNIVFASTPTHSWKSIANHLIIVNDSQSNSLIFSFNGEDLDGEVFPCDKSLTLNWKLASRIWLASSTASPPLPYRLWAWVE